MIDLHALTEQVIARLVEQGVLTPLSSPQTPSDRRAVRAARTAVEAAVQALAAASGKRGET